eukprot:Skav230641  [mRNA]  locus=scaffold1673:393530:393943:+ [translate_table: standard]
MAERGRPQGVGAREVPPTAAGLVAELRRDPGTATAWRPYKHRTPWGPMVPRCSKRQVTWDLTIFMGGVSQSPSWDHQLWWEKPAVGRVQRRNPSNPSRRPANDQDGRPFAGRSTLGQSLGAVPDEPGVPINGLTATS